MTPDRWREVERLYHAALEHVPGNERDAFLASACGSDAALRREVESLLAHSESRAGALDNGALAHAAQLVSHPDVPSMIGRRFRIYELVELIGTGGMGEVYRARDTRLSRDVAIKILPPAFKANPARVARFEREAQVLASLKHPHIGAVYGVEDADDATALVMELVDGEDLSERLTRGPLPIAEALTVARQIADALDAAHQQGIIHRDLKPANIRRQRDGTVKVLDFGLAKPVTPAVKDTPTLTALSAPVGRVMGTPAYMSPEQARGEPAEREADIWAFGVVLYELLTGISPFARSTSTETLTRVLTATPDEALLPRDTPTGVRRLLRRCLEKDPKRRWHHMGDVRIEIEEALASPGSEAASDPSTTAAPSAAQLHSATRSARRWRWLAAASLVIGIAAGAFAWSTIHPPSARPRPVVRFALNYSGGIGPPSRAGVGVSPDGTLLAYLTAKGIAVRARDQLETRILHDVGTFPSTPFFSPNGEWLAYVDGPVLKKVPVAGGAPIVIAETGPGATAVWAPEGIIFADVRGVFRVRDEGGMPERLAVDLDPSEQAMSPEMLPGGRAVLYTVMPTRSIVISGVTNVAGARIEVLEIATGARKTLIRGASSPRFLSSGHLIYLAGGTLHAMAFDPSRLEVRGRPVAMIQDAASFFAISDEGTLVYSAGAPASNGTLVWVDRQGREEDLGTPQRPYAYPRLSPDGTRVALDVVDSANRDIWMWDLRRRTLERFTVDSAGNPLMAWSPDGQRLAFGSDRFGPSNLFIQAANGSGEAERLLVSDRIQMPVSFAPDGRLLFSEEVPGQGRNVHALSLDGSRRVDVLLHTAANELNANVSPDGKWLAYDSNESGQFEIYVRPYPNVEGGRWKISLQGGRQPLWSRAGRELFYRDFSGAIMAAAVSLSPAFAAGDVTKILDGSSYHGGGAFGGGITYDLSLDGTRFLMIKREVGESASPSFVVVVNWGEELTQRVPVQ